VSEPRIRSAGYESHDVFQDKDRQEKDLETVEESLVSIRQGRKSLENGRTHAENDETADEDDEGLLERAPNVAAVNRFVDVASNPDPRTQLRIHRVTPRLLVGLISCSFPEYLQPSDRKI
jgi:hypothetical protein